MNKYKRIVLSNKAPIITVPVSGAKTTTALMVFKTGSRYETRKNSGISHFLEHMFFKGTKNRPDTLMISSALDALGCEFNAFTSKEYTGYWVKAAENKLVEALDVLGDMILNSKFDKEEIEREKGVIIEELNMYEDNPMMHIEDVLERCLFGDTPAGWDTIGTKENIENFARQDFMSYFHSQYGAKSAILVLAGGVKDRDIKKGREIMNKLGVNKWKKQVKNVYKQTRPQIKMSFKDTDQANISLAVRTFPIGHAEELNAKLLAVILGGAMSSRLFINLRERNGLAYYVKTDTEFYTDSGYLSTQAGVPTAKVSKAIEIILVEYARLKEELVSEEELTRAKDLLQGRMFLQMEASDNLANWYARQAVLRGQLSSPEEFLKKIKKVSATDLRQTAKKIFVNAGLNLAGIGRFKEAELKKILKF